MRRKNETDAEERGRWSSRKKMNAPRSIRQPHVDPCVKFEEHTLRIENCGRQTGPLHVRVAVSTDSVHASLIDRKRNGRTLDRITVACSR
jgi:hypothetical protein